jgi:hypothetical protein
MHLGVKAADGRIILKWLLQKQFMKVRTNIK